MSLRIEKLTIKNEKQELFKDFNLRIQKGEVYSLMGPSGSGKSTLLSFISGIIHNQFFDFSGRLFLDEVEITQLPIEKRKIGLLFQDDLLFPHMTVKQNLEFAMPSDLNKKNRQSETQKYLSACQMESYENRYPHTLSGGQRARISLLRTLASKPKVMLLDEPFSKLDVPLRKDFRAFTFNFIKELNIPTILVTHDENDIPENSQTIRLEEPTLLTNLSNKSK